MALPTVSEICNGRAGTLWNLLCCPFVMTFGLLYNSIIIYVVPCAGVLCFRGAHRAWGWFCCCFRWPYEDGTFFGATALGDFSVDDPNKETAQEMASSTDWVRAKDLDEFKGKRSQLFEGEIKPDDLCQGAVGNCWLVAALSSASEFPDCIRNMFVTKVYNPRGLYKIRIYDPIDKKFVIVTVDDRIPCKKGTKKPRFMSPNGNELWAIIIEKAYAKWAGSYAKLDGGFATWGWHAMTGDNVFQMSRNPDPTWYRENMVPIKDKDDKRACGFLKTKETFTNENLWTLLKKYDKQKALISASIGKVDYGKSNGPSGEQMLEKEGLVAGHAYSVIQARDVSSKGGEKFSLMQIRNPWGEYEWKGAWSDKSSMWKEHPKVYKELKFVAEDNGSFWMSFDDFKKAYTRVSICDRSTSKDASLDVNENEGSCGIMKGFCCGCLNFWLCCKGARNIYCSHDSTDLTRSVTTNRCCCCLPR